MREKIIIILFTLSQAFAAMADSLRTAENEDKEYRVSAFGKIGDFL